MEKNFNMNIDKLERSFIGKGEVKGARFNQKLETDKGYIYKVNDKYYEVFEKKLVGLCIDFENKIYSETDFKEQYPKSRHFGKWAWTVGSFEKGVKILNEL